MSEHEPAAAAQARGVGEAEAWEAIADWALRLAAASTEEERLRQGVLAVCDLVPPCHAASAVLVRHHRRVAEVAVGGDADAAEEAQDRHDEGPGLSALRTGVAEHVADLDAETRWPRWARSAREAGLGAALALPLPRSHGVLTLYAPRAAGFSPTTWRPPARWRRWSISPSPPDASWRAGPPPWSTAPSSARPRGS
ncbi:GAF domain-containing protein [Propioniciclava coleopterorum]|uniref:GAF domain-containing protein n=1 Tax=Propioniciclava coleopterorum TaxID=2714937 RepID=A0A6G7Y9L0_9ACTN|nr:GAF domain-containing protein [Propioniciclava coleopterorum]QIK73366.1 GAF domain-containing protein [Propioniciclava coleopterorum]